MVFERRLYVITFILILFLFLFATVALFTGPLGLSFSWPVSWLQNDLAIYQYRLSRITLAIIAGSSLAASGATLQSLFQNPLADPHLFGISGGAALGASIVIAFFSQSIIGPSIGAIIGGLFAFGLMFFYLKTAKNSPLHHCLLVGIVINSLAAGLITLFKTILPPGKTQSLLFWLVGNITIVNPKHFLIIIPLWLLAMTALFRLRGELEVLSFGIEEGQLLGIDTKHVLWVSIIANCILIGNVVAFSGMIGFLGLVIPHIVRVLISPNLRIILPLSAIASAFSLVFFDTLSRLSFATIGSEVPVGAISALFLAPLFFILLTYNDGFKL